MIVEMRTYTLAVGATARYLKNYSEKGLAVQTRILGNLVGYYSVEIGPLNQVIHLWGYDGLDDRGRRRAQLWADEEWLAYARDLAASGIVLKQETQVLTPAPFFTVPQPA